MSEQQTWVLKITQYLKKTVTSWRIDDRSSGIPFIKVGQFCVVYMQQNTYKDFHFYYVRDF